MPCPRRRSCGPTWSWGWGLPWWMPGPSLTIGLGSLGDDAPMVDVIDEVSAGPLPVAVSPLRQALAITSSQRLPGSSPYYNFGAQPSRYAFDWHGYPGGVPSSRAAGETRGLSGGGDLYESGLSPYSAPYPALRGRGFRMPHPGLAGLVSDLSDNEKKLLTIGAIGLAALVAWRHMKKSKRRANPARIRRGRHRGSVRRRRGLRRRRR